MRLSCRTWRLIIYRFAVAYPTESGGRDMSDHFEKYFSSTRALRDLSKTMEKWNETECTRQVNSALIRLPQLRETYRRVDKSSRVELMDSSLRRLSSLVDFAFQNNEYYRDLYLKAGYRVGGIRSFADFESLPVIDKT